MRHLIQRRTRMAYIMGIISIIVLLVFVFTLRSM